MGDPAQRDGEVADEANPGANADDGEDDDSTLALLKKARNEIRNQPVSAGAEPNWRCGPLWAPHGLRSSAIC